MQGMLNPFPIQWLSLFAYFLLRLFVGGLLIFLGFRHLSHRNELFATKAFKTEGAILLIVAEFCTGALVLVGAFTQYAVIGVMVLSSLFIFGRGLTSQPTIPDRSFWILLFGAALTLFITGAGALAFDLPL